MRKIDMAKLNKQLDAYSLEDHLAGGDWIAALSNFNCLVKVYSVQSLRHRSLK